MHSHVDNQSCADAADCENHCLMTINKFNDGTRFFTGNRCERGEGKAKGGG